MESIIEDHPISPPKTNNVSEIQGQMIQSIEENGESENYEESKHESDESIIKRDNKGVGEGFFDSII